MTMTDPIADMLTRVRNANVAMHDEVKMPSSKKKEALAALRRRRATSRTSAWPLTTTVRAAP
jgi:ribosomal protein S8